MVPVKSSLHDGSLGKEALRTEQVNGGDGHKAGVPKDRLIKLISVRLKEAALDSPTFRASTNFQSSQVEQIDHWIDGLLKTIRRYPTQFNDFKDVNSVMVGQLIPEFLRVAMLGQDTTLGVIQNTKSSLESLWNAGLRDMEINESEITDVLMEFSKTSVKSYKDIRKNFEYLQGKYDSLLGKFGSQSKTREPSAIREDAFQLYDVRQSYLSASLDICVEVSKFRDAMDCMLICFTDVLFRGKSTYDETRGLRLQAWAQAESKSVKSLLRDMQQSRSQIEKATVAQYEPSRDLKNHNTALINPALLTVPDEDDIDPNEKHGWLFMKTSVGKPARQIWVRRWVFVKNGIFGLLSLSPSRTFVQETDKIGVLLANIRYAPDEERRLCFEIKTIDCTVVFQAESLRDLRSWLRVFAEEKERAIESSGTELGKYAFGRYPPLFYEFASTSLTSIDIELTSSSVDNSNHDETHTTVISSYLCKLVDGSDGTEFQFSTSAADEFREPDLNPPMPTARSKLALLSHAFLRPTVVPTAVSANIWGSVNWGIYYMSDANIDYNGFSDHSEFSENNLTSLTNQKVYPSNYPAYLRNYDIQLRSLFESSIDPDELVLVFYTCSWSLNHTQDLSGRCFLTTTHAYYYLNSAGFVSLLKKPLGDLVAVEVSPESVWEVIKMYDVDGLCMKGRLFLDNGKLLQKKIDLLINNRARSTPRSQEKMISILESFKVEDQGTEAVPKIDKDIVRANNFDDLSSFQAFTGTPASESKMKTNYWGEFDLVKVANFHAPAKALFHILYGDRSTMFRDTILLVNSDEFNISPWFRDGEQLTRVMDYKLALSASVINLMRTGKAVQQRSIQTVEELVDNKYYRVEEMRGKFQVTGTGTFTIHRKVIIIETDAKSCKVLFYTKIEFISGPTNRLLAKIFGAISLNFEAKEIEQLVLSMHQSVHKLGVHGQVIRAIRRYGHLSQSETDHRPKGDFVFHLTFTLLVKYYFKFSLYFLTTGILNAGHYTSDIFSRLLLGITVHKVISLMLATSLLVNFFLAGRSTIAYWNSHNSSNMIASLKKQSKVRRLERSITLDDLEVLSSFEFNQSSSCFNKFKVSITTDEAGSSFDQQLRESRHQIAVKRNQLLVELKILEKVERELVAGDYKNFVLSEINLCKISLDEMQVNNSRLKEYCESCNAEYQKIGLNLL